MHWMLNYKVVSNNFQLRKQYFIIKNGMKITFYSVKKDKLDRFQPVKSQAENNNINFSIILAK
jgi:hypothetical protein